jgi:hypothetical protein
MGVGSGLPARPVSAVSDFSVFKAAVSWPRKSWAGAEPVAGAMGVAGAAGTIGATGAISATPTGP